MPTPKMTIEKCQEVYDAYLAHGKNKTHAAQAIGMPRNTFCSRLDAGKRFGIGVDPAIMQAAKAGGVQDPSNIALAWKKCEDDDGNKYSLCLRNPQSGDDQPFTELVQDAIDKAMSGQKLTFPSRPVEAKGDQLLIIDLADVHFPKLCVKSETGYEYNGQIAAHRVVEGTKALLRSAEGQGIGRILFILGNDVLHVDNAQKTTTSGTPQDVSGNLFQGYRDAFSAMVEAIKLCAEVADVDLVHNMSNHDWVLGWTLSRSIAAFFSGHPNVHFSDYNLSERHRKYYRYGDNLFGLSHGDGAKEEALYGVMVKEARVHISECKNLIWLLHHVHHKVRKTRGPEKPFLREKDHNGITAIMTGQAQVEGEGVQIEYIRSPSPPDGWHDRNGYVNRQAVEAFVCDPYQGIKIRMTEWF